MKNFKFNEKLYGINIRYYWSGNILIKCYYKNGLLNGEYIYYYYDGKISGKLYLKNGKKEGRMYYILCKW